MPGGRLIFTIPPAVANCAYPDGWWILRVVKWPPCAGLGYRRTFYRGDRGWRRMSRSAAAQSSLWAGTGSSIAERRARAASPPGDQPRTVGRGHRRAVVAESAQGNVPAAQLGPLRRTRTVVGRKAGSACSMCTNGTCELRRGTSRAVYGPERYAAHLLSEPAWRRHAWTAGLGKDEATQRMVRRHCDQSATLASTTKVERKRHDHGNALASSSKRTASRSLDHLDRDLEIPQSTLASRRRVTCSSSPPTTNRTAAARASRFH